MFLSGLYPSKKKNIWLGCCAPGSFVTVWQQPEAPFICIRPIPLSCALRNPAFGLRVKVISRHTYRFLRSIFYVIAKGSEDLALLPDGLVFVSSVSARNAFLMTQRFGSVD